MEGQLRENLQDVNRRALDFIQRFLAGDAGAFRSLVRLMGPRVTHIIQKMVYSPHDVEDVTSEVWLKVAQHLHKYNQSMPFHAWLYRVASNTCIDFLRRKREVAMEDDQLHHQLHKHASTVRESPEEVVLQQESHKLLNELLQQLDETDRLIVSLRFVDQLRYEEIGQIVGMSKNTVGTRLYRARKQLKDLFEQHLERRMTDAAY